MQVRDIAEKVKEAGRLFSDRRLPRADRYVAGVILREYLGEGKRLLDVASQTMLTKLDGDSLDCILGGYTIFNTVAEVQSPQFETVVRKGMKRSVESVERYYIILHELLANMNMTDENSITNVEFITDQAVKLSRFFPFEQKYRQLVEDSYHRLMAESLLRRQYDRNWQYFNALCAFKGIDPRNPPKG